MRSLLQVSEEDIALMIIRQIVQHVFNTGYLTVETEDKLRLLLQTNKYGSQDINAFMKLQQACVEDLIQQQSRQVADIEALGGGKYQAVCHCA